MNQSKTFSEFLVDQNLVSAEDLVALLITQSKSLPTAAEIMHSKKLLSPSQMLSVFTSQMKSGQDFVSACKAVGVWSDAVASAYASEMTAARVPIVQLLQSSGKVSTEKLVLALDSYLSENAQPATVTTATAVDNVVAPAVLAVAPEPPVAHVEAPITPDIANSDLDHLHEYYSQSLQDKILGLANAWDQSEFDVTAALLANVHGLVGAARFAKQSALEEIFANAESNIRALSDCATALPSASIQAFRAELCQAFEKAWGLRDPSSQHLSTAPAPNEVAV